MECIFCRIINGEIGECIYSDDLFIAIMDVSPLSRGHLLIIPRHHSRRLVDLPDAYLGGALLVIKKIVEKLGINIGPYNILQNNGNLQSVDHVHFHVIPYDADEKEGLSVNWNRSSVSSREIELLIKTNKKLLEE
ncbi:hypothetical protein NEFER03_0470 [Nematocida sp. LUAm3]|nr:hypothetical protein NEFER03_0470 [Nematocida sp. LUAm3]KAI5175927.1 hypothetical protein NEFER02_1787 [Nematocida sp. LUAm2]KAI5178691.1 hypothetical protein NEFER01_1810 [Nematocida sp. LUAm1]